MEERVKTSFIPKASLKVERAETKSRDPIAFVNIIAGIILLLSILGAGGMFLFERFSVQAIESKKQSLERSRAAFEPATIKELARLDTRITTGRTLLSNHPALGLLFDELEKRTLSTVKFNDLSYAAAGVDRILLTTSGEAVSFNAVALQSDSFVKSAIITEPIFSNVNISKTGTILFDFSAVIDTSRMKYTGGTATVQPANTGTTTPTL